MGIGIVIIVVGNIWYIYMYEQLNKLVWNGQLVVIDAQCVINKIVICKAVKFATTIFIAQGTETHIYVAQILTAILILFNIKLKLIAVSIYYNPIVTQQYYY